MCSISTFNNLVQALYCFVYHLYIRGYIRFCCEKYQVEVITTFYNIGMALSSSCAASHAWFLLIFEGECSHYLLVFAT